ncbi:Multiubiquitin [Variovorax sp. YR750]|uniref:multiubiquitin domain-containing protein n=1 Tax=Variovorax sp. YR750 TaxID=1884384 RepID=UPI0008BCC3B3|nr:multiubiquitin domain-containing protein [Variovorax sp. YR750]SEM15120.1 Multiubiquitin [Variovorax sp. YR750]
MPTSTQTPDPSKPGAKPEKELHIQIDRSPYQVLQLTMSGTEIRQLTTPPIGADRDLFEVVPGTADRKIANTDVVEIHNGQRFFTAPGQINPG